LEANDDRRTGCPLNHLGTVLIDLMQRTERGVEVSIPDQLGWPGGRVVVIHRWQLLEYQANLGYLNHVIVVKLHIDIGTRPGLCVHMHGTTTKNIRMH
jgi:hypothetical protein